VKQTHKALKAGWIKKNAAAFLTSLETYAYPSLGNLRVDTIEASHSRSCYLLPITPLQRAWRLHGEGWVQAYGYRRAQNPGYVTTCVPVPIPILMHEIMRAIIVQAH
jgi:hypothetical protein